MKTLKTRVSAQDLKIGMHVVELDRPWLDSPFLFQGFTIKTLEELNQLRQLCEYVFVSEMAATGEFRRPGVGATLPVEKGEQPARPRLGTFEEVKRAQGTKVYHTTAPFEEEIERAKDSYRGALARMHQVFDDVRTGRMFDIKTTRLAVRSIVESVLRNPSALVWFAQLQNREAYTALHCVNVSIYAVTLGRHLGLPPQNLLELGLGGLLHDIGKLRIPTEILRKPGRLTEAEFAKMKMHTTLGYEMLSQVDGLPPSVLSMALRHHEARNGQGYPGGLKAEEIDYYSRIIAVVDRYDALTSDRYYRDGVSPQDAIKVLYELRSDVLEEDLVNGFIQCLGVYPVGTVVELTSGEVGIVISSNAQRRLRPKVMLILDEQKRPKLPVKVVDLAHAQTDAQGDVYAVLRTLDPHSFGLNLNRYIHEYKARSLTA
jgi:putative nucleotidyltransferase with HDIG domain